MGNKTKVMEKRLDVLLKARLRDKGKIEEAISTQDRLRKKSEGWKGTEEIRNWRDSRC